MLRTILPTVCMLLIAAQAEASVIFTTFGAGDSFKTGATDLPLIGQSQPSDPPAFMFATPFTVSNGDQTFRSLEVALSPRNGSNPSPINFSIYTDNGGLPGTLIDTVTVNVPLGASAGVYAAGSALEPVLSNGATYWIAGQAAAIGSAATWHANDQGLLSTIAVKNNGTWGVAAPSFDQPAFRLSTVAVAVPEASGVVMALLGGAGVVALGLRRRSA